MGTGANAIRTWHHVGMSKRALIVVDVQNDFCEGGSLAVVGGAAVATAISEFLEREGMGYDFVVATRDHHIDPGAHFSDAPDFVDSWPPHCVADTPGASFHPNLMNRPFDAVFDKGDFAAAYSGFEGFASSDDELIGLGDWLDAMRVRSVDVCGIATDYCVKATALDAARHGLSTTMLLDLTAAVDPASVPSVVEDLAAAGVRVRSADADEGYPGR